MPLKTRTQASVVKSSHEIPSSLPATPSPSAQIPAPLHFSPSTFTYTTISVKTPFSIPASKYLANPTYPKSLGAFKKKRRVRPNGLMGRSLRACPNTK